VSSGGPGRFPVAALAWLALFSALFSIGAALDLWPPPPLGGFQGTDLLAGWVVLAALLVWLLVPRRGNSS
jgi:hypothetical protein